MNRKRFPPRNHQAKYQTPHPMCRGGHRRRNLQLPAWKRLCWIRSGWLVRSREKVKATTLSNAHNISSDLPSSHALNFWSTPPEKVVIDWNIFSIVSTFTAFWLWYIQISNCWKGGVGVGRAHAQKHQEKRGFLRYRKRGLKTTSCTATKVLP